MEILFCSLVHFTFQPIAEEAPVLLSMGQKAQDKASESRDGHGNTRGIQFCLRSGSEKSAVRVEGSSAW